MSISIRTIVVAGGLAALVAGCADVPYGYDDPYAYNGGAGYGYGPGYAGAPGYYEPGPSVELGVGVGFYDSDHHWHRGDRDHFDRDHDHDRGHDHDWGHDGDHSHGGDHDRGHDDHGSGG